MRVSALLVVLVGLLGSVTTKRACSSTASCDSSCKAERSQRHCKFCKCRTCAMCSSEAKPSARATKRRSRSRSKSTTRPLQRLGRSRQWTPEEETTVSNNRSVAAVLLRTMGYVPGPQIPLEFGGPSSDFEVDPSKFAALSRSEAAAAGPKLMPLHLQKAAAAHGGPPASWLYSPVAQLLPKERARPPTPQARKTKKEQAQLRKQQKQQHASSTVAGHATAMLSSLRNLTLNWRPGSLTRRAKPAGSLFGSQPAAVDVTGKVNLRALASPKWCGAYSGKRDKCEQAYLGRPDGMVNPCTYSAEKSKCAAGKKWVAGTGKSATSEQSSDGHESSSSRSKKKRKAAKGQPAKSTGRDRPPKRGKEAGKKGFRAKRTYTPEHGTELSWAGV